MVHGGRSRWCTSSSAPVGDALPDGFVLLRRTCGVVSWREREARNEERFRDQNEWEGSRFAVVGEIEGWGLRIARETHLRPTDGTEAAR